MKTSLLRLENLSRSYRQNGHLLTVLRDASLSLNQGDFCTISGPSGSGKSTLLQMMGLLDTPSHGKYYLDGEDVSDASPNRRAALRNQIFGYVFQSFQLIAHLRAYENVMLPLLYRGWRKHAARVQAEIALSQVGMSARADHRPNQLSGGQQQRVAIARALVGSPRILLADEPTGNLDEATGREIVTLFHELNQLQAITVIIITHDAGLAAQGKRRFQVLDGVVAEVPQDASWRKPTPFMEKYHAVKTNSVRL